jgi:periplasmic divalent cation tolerance protein
MTGVRLVLCTAPDRDVAERLAQGLLEAGLAACVNLLPGVDSVYRWQGQIERASEVLMLIKLDADRVGSAQRWLLAQHPYQTPEWIVLDVVDGSDAYLRWLRSAAG